MEQKPVHESWVNLLIPVALILGLFLLLSVHLGSTTPVTGTAAVVDNWLKTVVGYLAGAAEIAAAIVIGIGVLIGIVAYVRLLLSAAARQVESTESIRLRLGRTLALGLEFTVAGDILRTAVAPNPQDIVNLGAIVLLRSLLNYFLEREIRQVEARGVAGVGPGRGGKKPEVS